MNIFYRILFLNLFFFILNLNFTLAEEKKQSVAVIRFSNFSNIEDNIVNNLTECFELELLNSNKYILLPQNEINEIIEKNKFFDFSDPYNIIQFGKISKVQYVVIGSVKYLNNNILLSIKIMDIEKEKPIFVENKTIYNTSDLLSETISIAQKFTGVFIKKDYKSPFISTGLSMMIPGGGHFYNGGTTNYIIGGTLATLYVFVAYMAFVTPPEQIEGLSRQGWGFILISINAFDVISSLIGSILHNIDTEKQFEKNKLYVQ